MSRPLKGDPMKYLSFRLVHRGIAATAVALVVALIPGGNAADAEPPATPPGSAANILDGTLGDRDPSPELTTAEMQAALRDATIVVLDARPEAEYAVSHLPGARSVPGK